MDAICMPQPPKRWTGVKFPEELLILASQNDRSDNQDQHLFPFALHPGDGQRHDRQRIVTP
jgi:hypothetical protein